MKGTGSRFTLFSVLLVVALLFGGHAVSLVQAQSAQSNNGNDPIVGTWDITIPGTPFKILRTYNSNGTIVDAYAFPPFTFTPGPLINSAGHGVWERIGRGQYKAKVEYFQIDPTKNSTFQVLDSIGTVRELVTIDDSTGAYSSSFTTEVHDPSGNLLITNAAQTTGKAVKIDF